MVLSSIASVLAVHPSWGGPHGWAGGGWWWIAGPLWLLFWLAAIGIGSWFVARAVQRRSPAGDGRARAILAERYARGDISSEEYHERLDQLG